MKSTDTDEIFCFASDEIKSSNSPQGEFHMPQAYFTLRSNISLPKAISQIPQGFISLKKGLHFREILFSGGEGGI
ncbi:MAG: hypothetical protein IKM38_02330 [Christensenellaceae bacterium]|nr:hypothetical protein [Christensenellaceae bacterium]